ncbi:hypothetical protein ASG40_20080 [Methylobacterium sp. Leaf399]|uniref:hypothetical protein n=1 Tax=Methylobacterium sp. Leaf399 TaxID=1736364 RepID=UPI0007017383|nr:hypothetical protein [Methylobacterium sp. Leaf399]KQT10554.1 hypothetical protein ASG40_20080 [Methylobacterium sp. Leaf399]
MSASPVFTIEPDTPQAWRSAFLGMKPGVVPCPGMTSAKWRAIHAAALCFLDKHADEAAALGWTTEQLFGVHPSHGVIRVDFCGALVLSGEIVSKVETNVIALEKGICRRDNPGRPDGAVPIWAFKG